MITDSYLRLSDAQGAITADAVSTNTIDLLVAREIGEGEDIFMVFTVTTTGTGAGTVVFSAIVDTDAALATSVTTLVSSGAYVGTALTAATSTNGLGTQIILRLPPVIASLGKRYLGANYDVTGTVGALKVTCDIVTDISDGKKFYTSGFSIT